MTGQKYKQSISFGIAIVLILLMCISCAGIIVSGEAQYEFDKGLALFSQGQFAEAIPFFEKAVSLEPDFYQAYLYLGRSQLNLRNYSKALSSLRKAYRLSPEDFKKQVADILIDALLGAAFSELKEGNFLTSLSYIREILSTEPKSQRIKADLSRVLVAVATELFKSGKVREAIKEYTEAIKTDSSKTKGESLSKLISALPPETAKKVLAIILDEIAKDREDEKTFIVR
jgi:tetratricopeptide (TPR) repeat protein